MSDLANKILGCATILAVMLIFMYVSISIQLDNIHTELLKLAERPTPHGKEERR